MQIAVIGTGYVGLVSGVCFSEYGYRVTCVDKDSSKIALLQQQILPIYEPGLDLLLDKNRKAGRISFTTDIAQAVSQAQIVLIAVGTPSNPADGMPDTSYLFSAVEEVAKHIRDYTVIIVKSTVPIGSNRAVAKRIAQVNPDADFDVVSNPEFLREGSAIDDFMKPDRVVVGVDSKRALEVMQQLYAPVYLGNVPILATTLESAEMIKYTANTMLALRVAFMNEMADICENVGANIRDVAKGVGMDQRIGEKFLQAGPGFGGSCFPKDSRALRQIARNAGHASRIVEAVVEGNEARKRAMAEKLIAAAGGSVSGQTIAVLGLTFKPGTDDMRESPSIAIIERLEEAGASIRAYDPQGMKEAAKLMPALTYTDSADAAMQDADALLIITEWNEFRNLDLKKVKKLLKKPLVVDLRNLYRRQDMQKNGFHYVSVGRQEVIPGQPWIADLNLGAESPG